MAERLAVDWLRLDTVDSTNTVLKHLAREGAKEGTVVTALEQTGGRGRHGRSFVSQRGKGIFLSLLLRPTGYLPESVTKLTALTAVAVAEAVESFIGEPVGIKWTNDLILHGKKLCGILNELTISPDGRVEAVIVGIGLNVGQQQEDFPPELQQIATSLLLEGHSCSCEALAEAIVERMDAMYADFLQGKDKPYEAAYRSRCVNLGKEVRILEDPPKQAVAEDITESFGLLVQLTDGSRKVIQFGEVSVRGQNGYL